MTMNKTLFVVAAIFFLLPLRADDDTRFPLDFAGGEVTKSLVVRAKPIRQSQISPFDADNRGVSPLGGIPLACPSAWCIAYEMEKVGRMDLDTHGLEELDLTLQFDIGGLCDRKPSQWSKQITDRLILKIAKAGFKRDVATGCTVDVVEVALISAAVGTRVFSHNEPPEVDFTGALKAIQARRDVEETRRKRVETDRKQKEAAETARGAKLKAAQEASAAEERAKVRAGCRTIYRATIDKKARDLTVREEEQIRACQVLGLYPPP